MENRNGLVAAAEATLATGTAEREAAERLSRGLPKGATLGADKNYDAEAFVALRRSTSPILPQNPASTILPIARPDLRKRIARMRLAASMRPKFSRMVERTRPESTRSATSFKSLCWASMSAV